VGLALLIISIPVPFRYCELDLSGVAIPLSPTKIASSGSFAPLGTRLAMTGRAEIAKPVSKSKRGISLFTMIEEYAQ
jgi:hypothetical protein